MKFIFIFLLMALGVTSHADYDSAIQQWEEDLWESITEHDVPWVWSLNLWANVVSLHNRVSPADVKYYIDKLHTHPAPSPEALYWAANFCRHVPSIQSVCRMDDLFEKLIQVDGSNLYSSLLFYNEIIHPQVDTDKTGDDRWNWELLDTWLERLITIPRATTYHGARYVELWEMIQEFGSTHGVLSEFRNAQIDFRSVMYIKSELLYAEFFVGELSSDCKLAKYMGREKTNMMCRQLAQRMVRDAREMDTLSSSLFFESNTYDRDDYLFLRLKRESVAWNNPIPWCLDPFRLGVDKPVYIRDVLSFVQTYEKDGQIAAWTNAAEQESWKIVDENTPFEHACADIQGFDDRTLKEQLGQKDFNAMQWCHPEDGCIDPVNRDE